MSLRKHKQDWEDLGNVDPLWAIFSQPERKYNKWDINEFFITGDRDVSSVMECAVRLGHPAGREIALDFGCGVGRLTRALARYFRHCYGVDVSESMIAKAKELNRSVPNCEFLVNVTENLSIFNENAFDLIYAKWVLQHLPSTMMIRSYIAEFIRTLKPAGLLVFQLRTHLSFKTRLQLGRRLYTVLRALRLNEQFLYERLRLNPIRVIAIPGQEVIDLLKAIGAQILEVQTYAVPSGRGKNFYVTK